MISRKINRVNLYARMGRECFKRARIWSAVMATFLVAMMVSGAVMLGQARATDDEPEEVRPTMTVVSVSQYGEVIEPVWDEYLYDESKSEFGKNYYPTANNSDPVTIGVRLDGLVEGTNYVINDGSWNSYNEVFTAADNGRVVYRETKPTATMTDSVECDEDGDDWWGCSYTNYANEYRTWMYLEKNGGDWESYGSLDLIFRPAVVGSSDIEIISVKQNGEDVVLDTVGRQVKDLRELQTINEYQLLDYTSPVTIEYRFKNLQVGWYYYGQIGSKSFSFTANTSEVRDSEEVTLEALNRHASVRVSLDGYSQGTGAYGYTDSEAMLYFRVMDESFEPLGDFVVEEIRQGGVALEATEGEWWDEYVIEANDVQDLEVKLRATSATDTANYYVGYALTSPQLYSGATGWTRYSGAELKEGATLTVPAKYGESDKSPFSLYLYVKMSEESYDYQEKAFYYGEPDEYDYAHDSVKINFRVNESVPRPSVNYNYVVYQGEDEMLPNDEGVFVVRNYTEPIYLKVTVDDESDTRYCLRKDYVSLDDEDEVIRNSHNSRYSSYCDGLGESGLPYGSTVYLDIEAKTTQLNLGIYDMVAGDYGSYNRNRRLEDFSVKFAYASYDSGRIPRIEMTELRQGGRVVEPTGYGSTAEFRVNTAEDYEYDVRGYNLMEGVEYVSYIGNNETRYSKNELENGLTITAAAGNYQDLIGRNNYSAVFGNLSGMPVYAGMNVNIVRDSSLNEEVPTYDICVKYRSDEGCLTTPWNPSGVLPYSYGKIDMDNYDAVNNPAVFYIKGDKYREDANYNVNVEVRYLGEIVVSEGFTATGLEIKEGITKEYFNPLRYATLAQMMSGDFEEGGYNITVTIGYTTKTMIFVVNGEANASMAVYSADGLPFGSYIVEGEGGGLGAGGEAFVGYAMMQIPEAAFGDHAYLYLGSLYGAYGGNVEVNEANYHVYEYSNTYNVNDLSGATLISEGMITSSSAVGLIRLDRGNMGNNFYFTVVLEKNGRILSVQNYEFELIASAGGAIGFMPSLMADDENRLFSYDFAGTMSYYVSGETPIKVGAYGAKLNRTATYTVDVTVKSSGVKMYENSREVTAAELDGSTALVTIPYRSLFYSSTTYTNIEVKLKNAGGEVLAARTIYLDKDGGGAGSIVSFEEIYAGIQELEANGQEPVGPEEPEAPEIRVPETVGEVSVEGNTVTVQASKACVVIGVVNGELVKLEKIDTGEVGENGEKIYEFDAEGATDVIVAVKGDGDLDGAVSTSDSNLINRSLISSSLRAHRELTEAEIVLFDMDGDGVISTGDSNLINRSLISSSLRMYKAIEW